MNDQQNAKIDAGVRRCLEYADSELVPFTRLAEFVRALQEDATWAPAEIIELQTRVIRELLSRQNGQKPKSI